MGFPIGQGLTIRLDWLAPQIHLSLHPWYWHYKCVSPYKLIYVGLGINKDKHFIDDFLQPSSKIFWDDFYTCGQSEHLGRTEEEEGLG